MFYKFYSLYHSPPHWGTKNALEDNGDPSASRIWSGDLLQGEVYVRKFKTGFCETKDAVEFRKNEKY